MDTRAVRNVLATTRPADWLLVASLLVVAWFEIWVEPIFQTGMPGPRVPVSLFATVTLVPLLARRAFPLAALVVMCLGMVAVGIVGDTEQSTFVLLLGLLVATYSLAARATPRNALIGAVVVVVAAILFESFTFAQKTASDVLVPMLFVAAAWAVGRQVQRQRQRATELAEHSELLARTHKLETQAAVSAERTRIARELHDVVAHAISVMGIQAGAARRTLAPGQNAQREALLDVERLGREAIEEMQHMLGVLRTAEDDLWIDPLPDLAQLAALASDARNSGVEVVLDVAAEPDRLPRGLQLTAYRVVQEALTNVRKHAQASTVHITIARSREHLDVMVADDGIGVTGEAEPGNGLIGMRERVAIHHGTLYAGAGYGKGFLIRARLPVHGDE
ncbi:MAG: sensor histidine kinase [Dehalococcoidia bacterium]|nr:sensor histidine kinase [Dehalococcoidia bacterium]